MYVRMLIMMFIGFYTSRVVFKALGISDLGIINVAGSVLAMFSFINETFVTGTQRFLSFAIGEGNPEKLKKTFRCAFTIHVLIATLIFILGETIGLWYVCNKLVVDPNRFTAALWCYQLSIISTVIGIIQIPFQSALIAHEKISIYAYMSIYDAVGALMVAYLIQTIPLDRIIMYSSFTFAVSFMPTFFYNYYCRKHFKECAFRCGYDKEIFKNMVGFSGWNTLGCLSGMGQGAGINLILNAFCGTVINGARGIALQANGWANKFVNSFLAAINPQIVKSYASGDIDRMSVLVINGSRFGCYLFLLLSIPLFLKIDFILNIWLGQCPPYTIALMRIAMLETFFKTMGVLTVTAMHATGRAKLLNIVISPFLLLILPLSYFLFKIGFTPEMVMLANVIPWTIIPLIRVYLLKKCTNNQFSAHKYFVQVYLKTIVMAIMMFMVPFFFSLNILKSETFIDFMLVSIISVLTSSLVIYYIGINAHYREKLKLIVRQKISRIVK